MEKFINAIIRKQHVLFVEEKDILVVMNLFDEIKHDAGLFTLKPKMEITLATRGLIKPTKTWCMKVELTDKQWCDLVAKMISSNFNVSFDKYGRICIKKDEA